MTILLRILQESYDYSSGNKLRSDSKKLSTLKTRAFCDLGGHKDTVHAVCLKKALYLLDISLATGDVSLF